MTQGNSIYGTAFAPKHGFKVGDVVKSRGCIFLGRRTIKVYKGMDSSLHGELYVGTTSDSDVEGWLLNHYYTDFELVVSAGIINTISNGYWGVNPQESYRIDIVQGPVLKDVCECGAHKAGSNFHSSWCPLHE